MWIVVEDDARRLHWREQLGDLEQRAGTQVCTPERGAFLLRRLAREAGAAAQLRGLLRAVEPASPVQRLGDDAIRERLLRLVASGRVGCAETRLADYYEWGTGTKELKKQDEVRKETASILYEVVDDATGDPISDVVLFVTLPGGSEVKRTTNGEGQVKFDGIEAGRCSVRADREGRDVLHVLAFDGFGGAPRGVSRASHQKLWDRPKLYGLERAGTRKAGDKKPTIAVVIRHRVKTGETFASIAERYDVGEDELLEFNFGTTDEAQVQKLMRRELGCRVRNFETGDYELSSSDDPGIVHVPKPWEAKGQLTNNDYTIRVHRIEPHQPSYVFSL